MKTTRVASIGAALAVLASPFARSAVINNDAQSVSNNITVYQPGVAFAPAKLPVANAAGKNEDIVELFSRLGRSTIWTPVKKIDFGYYHEPEGMVRIGEDRYVISDNEYFELQKGYPEGIVNGTNRTPGTGFGYITIVDGEGKKIARTTFNEIGDLEYHNGGIDYDGEFLWTALAQYRPNTTTTVFKIDPHTLESTQVMHLGDHFGAIVHNKKTEQLVLMNWGSRNGSTFDLKASKHNQSKDGFRKPVSTVRNPAFFIDYQDCKFLGYVKRYENAAMLCSGIATLAGNATVGGLAIVDTKTLVPLMEVPFQARTDRGFPITQNPMDVDVVDGKLRFYFMPDQEGDAAMYIYEAEPESPFQFGGGPQ